ncbi:hypothetical protein ZIOFF_048372 [Zingiber officinale]|uniref:Sugar phosphate transporter domain-containing protein n=1 Tax=Zingiber officinale TaxID=94328 RepID=A0A8J5FT69_ZINOF|nr:hypothetical protein ZIOFF_048372 [Zingiber officinale]
MAPASKADKKAALDAAAWMFNVVSSVGIIIVNKALMATYGFSFATTLTGLHFATTTLMTLLFRWLGYIQPSSLPLSELLRFVLFANLSIVGMNVSLMWNSVGFYQIAKLCIIPVLCLLEVVFDKIRYSRATKLSILVVLIGVAICTITDVSVNGRGMIAATIAVWSTALQQYLFQIPLNVKRKDFKATLLADALSCIGHHGRMNLLEDNIFFILSTKTTANLPFVCSLIPYVHFLQRKYSLGSFNLLGHTAPAQAASLLVLGPFLDYWLTGKRVDTFGYSVTTVFFIILSCTIAIGTNLSQFICIGRFTAVSFQVLGHMKTILVLILGFFFFGKEGLNLHVVFGMILAVVGMIWYGNASSKPGGKERRSYALPTDRSPKHGLLSETGGRHDDKN